MPGPVVCTANVILLRFISTISNQQILITLRILTRLNKFTKNNEF